MENCENVNNQSSSKKSLKIPKE